MIGRVSKKMTETRSRHLPQRRFSISQMRFVDPYSFSIRARYLSRFSPLKMRRDVGHAARTVSGRSRTLGYVVKRTCSNYKKLIQEGEGPWNDSLYRHVTSRLNCQGFRTTSAKRYGMIQNSNFRSTERRVAGARLYFVLEQTSYKGSVLGLARLNSQGFVSIAALKGHVA